MLWSMYLISSMGPSFQGVFSTEVTTFLKMENFLLDDDKPLRHSTKNGGFLLPTNG